MKVDLLLTEDGSRQFHGGVREGLEEAAPPHHGLRGWLERERKRLATLWAMTTPGSCERRTGSGIG